MTVDGNDSTESEILQAEDERCRAIAANDWSALDQITGDDFTYTHSNGKQDNKTDWMAGLVGRPRVIERQDLVVRPLGDVALLSGGLTMQVTPPDAPAVFVDLNVLQVWAKRNGRWQLIANHATKNTAT